MRKCWISFVEHEHTKEVSHVIAIPENTTSSLKPDAINLNPNPNPKKMDMDAIKFFASIKLN